jgi:hypothetical protein
MRILIIAPLLLWGAVASAQTPVKPAPMKPATTAPGTVVKPVTPASSATQRPLPIEVRGITITTPRLNFVLRRL